MEEYPQAERQLVYEQKRVVRPVVGNDFFHFVAIFAWSTGRQFCLAVDGDELRDDDPGGTIHPERKRERRAVGRRRPDRPWRGVDQLRRTSKRESRAGAGTGGRREQINAEKSPITFLLSATCVPCVYSITATRTSAKRFAAKLVFCPSAINAGIFPGDFAIAQASLPKSRLW